MKILKPQISDTPIKRCIALISDLHFGSIYSLAKDYKTSDGRIMIPSFEQNLLTQIFEWCKKIMLYWSVDTIIFLGDLIQGVNRKSLGRETTTTDLEEQQDIAVDYLKPIVFNRKVYGVSGTTYHKSIDTEIERDIIRDLNGTFLNKMAWIKVKDSSRILNVSHESAKSTIFPLGALEREAQQLLRAYGEGKLPHRPDIIIRGHRHIFAHLHTTSYHGIYVPAFQTWYPFKTSYYGALQSDIGIAILFIDKKDRVVVHHYTKKIPIQIGDKTFEI